MVSPDEAADVCVVNSCTVTNVGDQKSRQLIRRLRRANPDSLLAVTGCYAAVAPLQVERLTGADLVAGLAQKDELVELVGERLTERGWNMPQATSGGELVRATPRTRLNVKVQDGCDDFCTYCIVPFSRGRARSLAVDDVVRQVKRAAPYRKCCFATPKPKQRRSIDSTILLRNGYHALSIRPLLC